VLRAIAFAVVIVAAACGSSEVAPSASPRAPSLATAATVTARATPTPAPTPATSSAPSFVMLSAPSANVVWALVDGPRLFRSTDSGSTWEQRAVPGGAALGEVSFIDEREGWLFTPSTATRDCDTQQFAIFHTADRAASWQPVLRSDAADPLCKSGVTFTDPQRGWITLTAPNGAPQVARTTDGGASWLRSFALPPPPGHRFGAESSSAGRVSVFGGVLLMSAYATSTPDGGVYAAAYRSGSNGLLFTFVATAPEQATPISFVSATRWLALGPSTKWRETTDGGATWHDFVSDYRQAAPAAPELVFADPSVGYAIFRGQIQRTTDGGAHWSALKTPGT